ncbi:MAG TPA: hypothetical protein VM597_40070 [Gemmataceae bacterium]|jgi:hypothetical protein|nr:hypothetical protein [Gemmataceae bacterium]
MNSFLRVGLPILVVVAVVFGITFVRMYTSPEEGESGSTPVNPGKTGVATESALKFHTLRASPPNPAVLAKPEGARFLHLKYWDPQLEIGAAAAYAYWAENKHDQQVRLRAFGVGCQCTGLSAAVVPPDLFREYLQTSALAGSPLCPAAAPVTAIAHAALHAKLDFVPLLKDGQGESIWVPPADPKAGPQQVIVKMLWTGKDPVGPKANIIATLFAGIAGQTETKAELIADAVVVHAFDLFHREGADWKPVAELRVGELKRNAVARQTFYCLTTTRPTLVLSGELDPPDPCITVTGPTPATPEELRDFAAFTARQEKPYPEVKAMFRFDVTVRERLETEADGKRETRFLDLGPLDRKLVVKGIEAGSATLAVRGLTVGEVSILQGAADGRIELGNSFAASQDRTVDVLMVGEKPDVDLSLVSGETNTRILKVDLTPLGTVGGKKQWRLRVTVPKGTLYSAVPEGTAVVLTTGGPTPRKLRIPVRGAAYDSGPAL